MSDADDMDRMLARAGRALRDEVSGASDDAARTRARVLATRRNDAQRTVWAIAAAVTLAIGLGAPTVWAWSTGRLAAWVEGRVEGGAETQPAVGSRGVDRERAIEPAVVAPTTITAQQIEPMPIDRAIAAQQNEPTPIEPVVIAETPRVDPEPSPEVVGGPTSETDEAPEPVDPAERRAYRAAHALHFDERAPEAALDAWERYLEAYPRGRFAPEARYNRALCLVRLGRRDDARTALAPFAEGAHGSYRQHEASQLLDAMSE